MICSPDGDTDFFDIVTGILQVERWLPFLFIISLDYVQQMSIDRMKEIGFILKKATSKWYPVETIMDVDYADDQVILANTPAQAECCITWSKRHCPICELRLF